MQALGVEDPRVKRKIRDTEDDLIMMPEFGNGLERSVGDQGHTQTHLLDDFSAATGDCLRVSPPPSLGNDAISGSSQSQSQNQLDFSWVARVFHSSLMFTGV